MDKETCVTKAFEIIGYGGDAKGCAYEAFSSALAGDFDEADRLMAEAREQMVKAHNIQTEFITRAAQGEEIPLDILFVHSQDHLMTAIEAQTLLEQMVAMQRRIAALEAKVG